MGNISFVADVKAKNFIDKNSGYNESVNLSLKGNLNKIDADIREFSIASNVIKGTASVELSGTVPNVVVALNTDKIDISPFMKKDKVAIKFDLIKEAKATTLVANDVVPYALLNTIGAKVDINIDNVVNNNAILAQNLKSVVRVNKGVASFEILDGTICNGKVKSDITLSAMDKSLKIII